jgi:hypothetical protein
MTSSTGRTVTANIGLARAAYQASGAVAESADR